MSEVRLIVKSNDRDLFYSLLFLITFNFVIILRDNNLLFEGFNDIFNRIQHDAPNIEALYVGMQ